MRALCLALLVVPTAALLKVAKKNETVSATTNETVVDTTLSDVRPKSASPEGVEVLWQRPHGEPKGILLYLHGCHGRATGMWTSDGPDGFHFDVCDQTKKKKCMGYVEEVLLRQRARKRGYLVAAVTGGVGSPRNCMNTNDVPRIQLALQHIQSVEADTAGKPVIMTGHSSGGRVLPELVATGAGVKNAKCIVPIADEIRIKGDSAAPLGVTPNYPEDVNCFFVHMARDTIREENVQKNIHQMIAKGVRTGDIKIPYAMPVTKDLFYADGYGLSNETSDQLSRALMEGQLLDVKRVLVRNPYATGDGTWQEVFKKKGLVNKGGGYAVLQQYMDVAWSEHWMAGGRYLDQILEFCNQDGYKKRHDGGKAEGFDLVAKVHEVDHKAENWKKIANKGGQNGKKMSKEEREKMKHRAAQMK